MNVAELIDILSDMDPQTIVEMAIVAPIAADSADITVDQYTVEGVLPRHPEDHEGENVVWLIGGEESDVDEFIDAVEGNSDTVHTAHSGELVELKPSESGQRPR